MKTAVIGIGNESRGDDGIGLVVVRELQAKLPPEVGAQLSTGEATELLEYFRQYGHVILVDAVVAKGKNPGEIIILNPDTLGVDIEESPGCSTHAFGIAQAIGLAEALDCMPTRLSIVGICGSDFRMMAELSPVVAGVKEQAIEAVLAMVQEKEHA